MGNKMQSNNSVQSQPRAQNKGVPLSHLAEGTSVILNGNRTWHVGQGPDREHLFSDPINRSSMRVYPVRDSEVFYHDGFHYLSVEDCDFYLLTRQNEHFLKLFDKLPREVIWRLEDKE